MNEAAHDTVGILVVAHGDLAAGLLGAVEEILGPQTALAALRLDPGVGDPRETMRAAVREIDGGRGVLALTDLFGGTPANVALALGSDLHVEVVTGVNLPMLLRVLSRRHELDLDALAAEAYEYGRKQIMRPNQLLVRAPA